MKKKPTSEEQYLDENYSDIEPITAAELWQNRSVKPQTLNVLIVNVITCVVVTALDY